MMPDIIRQNIIEKIQQNILAINNSTGEYFFNYPNKVFINKQTPFASIGINIRTVENNLSTNSESSLTLWNAELTIEIDIVCTNAAELSNLYKYEADILKCIGNNLTLDNLVINIIYQSTVYNNIDQLGNKIGDATIRLQILYRQKAWGL